MITRGKSTKKENVAFQEESIKQIVTGRRTMSHLKTAKRMKPSDLKVVNQKTYPKITARPSSPLFEETSFSETRY